MAGAIQLLRLSQDDDISKRRKHDGCFGWVGCHLGCREARSGAQFGFWAPLWIHKIWRFEHKLKPGHPTIILARGATISYKVSHPRLIP